MFVVMAVQFNGAVSALVFFTIELVLMSILDVLVVVVVVLCEVN